MSKHIFLAVVTILPMFFLASMTTAVSMNTTDATNNGIVLVKATTSAINTMIPVELAIYNVDQTNYSAGNTGIIWTAIGSNVANVNAGQNLTNANFASTANKVNGMNGKIVDSGYVILMNTDAMTNNNGTTSGAAFVQDSPITPNSNQVSNVAAKDAATGVNLGNVETVAVVLKISIPADTGVYNLASTIGATLYFTNGSMAAIQKDISTLITADWVNTSPANVVNGIATRLVANSHLSTSPNSTAGLAQNQEAIAYANDLVADANNILLAATWTAGNIGTKTNKTAGKTPTVYALNTSDAMTDATMNRPATLNAEQIATGIAGAGLVGLNFA